jgi:dipeptidyl aminopeptidase/acylaminoacyl peptidase
MRFRSTLLAPLAALLAVAACGDPAALIAPPHSAHAVLVPNRAGDRLASIEWEGATPRLYLQNLDGTGRVRVSFAHVSDHVQGNYSPRQLPVTDESLMRISRVRWSPDGRFLAVIVAPATDAMQVVLVSADGRALRTVSPNSQYLWGNVEWSADGNRVAYIMATGPFGLRPDLFVTRLGPDDVTRVTTGARLSGYDAIRFDTAGTRILFTEHLGWADDGENSLSRLASVELSTGAVTRGETVVGEPQGFARDGSWALFIRTVSVAPYVRELFRLPSSGGKATVLASGSLGSADVAENGQEAVLSSWSADGTAAFSVIGLGQPGDAREKLSTTPSTTWASLRRAPQ